jgi:tetratricopeptide (TPR) repeat protein
MWSQEGLALSRQLGDAYGVAKGVFRVGADAVQDGDWARATALLNESLEHFRGTGELYFIPWITRALAWARASSGDLTGARVLYEEGLRAAREIGSTSAQAALLGSLGWLAGKQGRARDALVLYHQSLTLKREIGDQGEIAIALAGSALALARLGDWTTAARLLGCATELGKQVGVGEAWVESDREEALELVRANLDEEAFSEAWHDGARRTTEDAVAIALHALSGGPERLAT